MRVQGVILFLSILFFSIQAFPQEPREIQVVDLVSGEPIAGAIVLLGLRSGIPFDGNLKTTDDQGKVTFSDNEQASPITIAAEGYVRRTYLSVTDNNLTVRLEKLRHFKSMVNVAGIIENHPEVVDGDKLFDAGIVVPFLNLELLLNFNLDQLMAPPETVNFGRYVGNKEVPGNLYAPDQEESFTFFPVLLSKPTYFYPAECHCRRNFLAAYGQFPMEKLMTHFMKNAPISDTYNLIQVQRVGYHKDFCVEEGKALNIPLQYTLEPQLNLRLDDLPHRWGAIALSLLRLPDSPGLFSVDFRLVQPKSVNPRVELKLPRERHASLPYTLVLVMDLPETTKDERPRSEGATGILQPLATGSQTTIQNFLPVVSLLRVGSTYTYRLPRRADPSPVTAASVSTFYGINEVTIEDKKITSKTKTWEVIGGGESGEFQLPILPEALPNYDKWEWNLALVSYRNNASQSILEESIDQISHFSRNSETFRGSL